MNKKILYTSIAVLLALVAIVALLAKNSTPSQDDNISTPEEPPIIGDVQYVQEHSPEDITELTPETTSPDKEDSAKKPQNKSVPATSKPTTSKPAVSKPTGYEDFMNMSSEQQQNFVDSFSSMDDFFAWYNSAKAVYEQENPPIEVGDGVININEIIKNKD